MTFEPQGSGTKMLGSGWSEPDPAGFAWSDGPEAGLIFAVATPARDMMCHLELMPFVVPGVVEQQQIVLYFNHFRVAFAELQEGRQTLAAYLPRELFILRTAVLNLHLPAARSPLDLGLSADQRRLGVALLSFQMVPVQ